MLLGVAIYLLERIVPEGVSMFLWGALLIGTAVYFGALDALQPQAGGWRRLGNAFGLVMGIYGVLIIVGAAGGGNDVFRPLKGTGFIAVNPHVQHHRRTGREHYHPAGFLAVTDLRAGDGGYLHRCRRGRRPRGREPAGGLSGSLDPRHFRGRVRRPGSVHVRPVRR